MNQSAAQLDIGRRICNRHDIPIARELTYYRDSNPVFFVDDRYVIKTFPPGTEREGAVELAVLRALDQTVPAPRPVADGTIDGASYIIMTAMTGDPLEKVWPAIEPKERTRLAQDIGTMLLRLHQIDLPEMAEIEARFGGWREFRQEHGAAFRKRLPDLRMISEPLRREILAFLDEEAPAHIDAPPALIHADVGPGHIYLAQHGGTWQLTGMIDFADAMLAPVEFEWTDGLIYLFLDDVGMRHKVLAGYYETAPKPDDLERRCLANLMHSYAAARWITEMHAQAGHPELQSLTDLQNLMFPPHE